MKSARTYQREIAKLKQLLRDVESSAVSTPKFKVGDKVKIVRKFGPYSGVSVFVDGMKQFVNDGNVYTIKRVDALNPPRYYLEEMPFNWVEESLELADEVAKQVEEEAQAIIKDAMRYRSLISNVSVGSIDIVVARRNWEKNSHEDGGWEMLNLDICGKGKELIDVVVDAQIEQQQLNLQAAGKHAA